MAGNPNYDALLSTTLKNYRRKLEDNIFPAQILFYYIYKGGNKELQDGGTHIVVPLMYGKNEAGKTYSGYDKLDTTPQEGITAAEYNWKQYSIPIAISRAEERKNSGKHQIINLLKAKIMQAEESARDDINEMLFSDGTGNGGKDLLGLKAIVADNPTSGTLAGIDRSTNTWWRNKYQASVGSFATNGASMMRSMYNSCTKQGVSQPDLIITTQSVYEYYEESLTDRKRFTDETLASEGFVNLKYKGAVITYDSYCPSGSMYFLTTKYLKLIVDAQTDFITTPFQRPTDQDAKVAHILFMGNFVASNCARQGVATGITA